MAHTPLMRRLRLAMRTALDAKRHGWSAAEAVERAAAARFSRRDALRGMAAAGSLAGVATAVGCGNAGPQSHGDARVAVIGAGMAGLHCAYRLMRAGVRVDVFEASERLGGRMFTARDGFPEGLIAEMGGELIDTGHATMHALAAEFDIALDDLFADYPDDADFETDTWHFFGERASDEEIVEQFVPLASIMADTVAAAEADDALFAQVDNTSLKDWLAQAAPDAELIRTLLEIAYNIEYGLEPEEQSPFNLLYLIDYDAPDPFRVFGDSDERFHTHTGNDTFTTALAEALGDRVHTGARLVAVSQTPMGRYRVSTMSGARVDERVYEHVVFALPMTKLREVEIDAEISDIKRRIIDELGYGSNSKLMGAFSEKVWRTHGAAGSWTTDNGIQAGWDTSRGQGATAGLLTFYTGGHVGWDAGRGFAEDRAREFAAKLDELYPGVSDAYVPGTAARMFWPEAPWVRGSYTCYRPGQWEFYSYEGQREGNLHFCGEHASLDYQGYMEGAAETGALVAAEVLADLGISAPQNLRAALGPKLYLPQSCYRGRRAAGLRFAHRRRMVAAAFLREGGRSASR